MMTLKDKLLRISLIFLVSLSIVLSYFIWMSPIQSPAKEELNRQMNVAPQPTNAKANTEVYMPSKVVWHKEDGNKISTSEALIGEIQEELRNSTFGDLEILHLPKDVDYKERLLTKDAVELNYIGHFNFNEYARIYRLSLKKVKDNIPFNRLLIDFKEKKLYVMNDATKTIYASNIEINEKKVNALLAKEAKNYVNGTIGEEILPYYYYIGKSLSLPMYSYIVSTQPYTTFTKAFFANPNDFSIANNGNVLVYESPNNESLEITNTLGKVSFKARQNVEPNAKNIPNETNLFEDSYRYIERLGTQLGNIRYFDEEDGTLNFTTYIEGYPVFSKYSRGQIHFRYNEDNDIEVATNVQMIQIPIPSDEMIELKSTQDVLKQLQSENIDISKIDSIQIGYEWQNVEETGQVVNLIPQWFIHYENHWWSEREIVTEIAKAGGH